MGILITKPTCVLHNSCNMGTRRLPDMYTPCPRACGPRASGVHIRQTIRAHVTTIKCVYFASGRFLPEAKTL